VWVDIKAADKAMRNYIKHVLMRRKREILRDAEANMMGWFGTKDRSEAIRQVFVGGDNMNGSQWSWIYAGTQDLIDMANDIRAACSVSASEEIGLTVKQAAIVSRWQDNNSEDKQWKN
jgi:hypothetical protein